MFSAVKVNGKRLYEYARKGIEIERPSRTIQIYSLELLDDRNEFYGETISFRFRVSCSKGTYIRTLAVMIGEQLGYPAHMSDLCRMSSLEHSLYRNVLHLEEIEEKVVEGTADELLHPLETALAYLPKYMINDKIAEKVINGAVFLFLMHFRNEKDFIVMESTTVRH